MVHLLAAIATDAEHMPSLIHSLRRVLEREVPEEARAEVWGLGYYADGRALTMRKPGELLEGPNYYELAAEVRSSVVLACVQEGTSETQQAPPHRFRRWLFSAQGDLSALMALRPRILDGLPGFIRSEIQDGNPGELAFGMFLRELHDKGLLGDSIQEGAGVGQALGRATHVMKMLAEEAGIEAPRASFAATNGRLVVATHNGPELHYKLQEGLESIPEGPLDSELHDVQLVVEALKRFRAVVICGGMEAPPTPEWSVLPADKVLWVDRSLNCEVI